MHLMEPPSMDRGGKTGKLCFILFLIVAGATFWFLALGR